MYMYVYTLYNVPLFMMGPDKPVLILASVPGLPHPYAKFISACGTHKNGEGLGVSITEDSGRGHW